MTTRLIYDVVGVQTWARWGPFPFDKEEGVYPTCSRESITLWAPGACSWRGAQCVHTPHFLSKEWATKPNFYKRWLMESPGRNKNSTPSSGHLSFAILCSAVFSPLLSHTVNIALATSICIPSVVQINLSVISMSPFSFITCSTFISLCGMRFMLNSINLLNVQSCTCLHVPVSEFVHTC